MTAFAFQISAASAQITLMSTDHCSNSSDRHYVSTNSVPNGVRFAKIVITSVYVGLLLQMTKEGTCLAPARSGLTCCSIPDRHFSARSTLRGRGHEQSNSTYLPRGPTFKQMNLKRSQYSSLRALLWKFGRRYRSSAHSRLGRRPGRTARLSARCAARSERACVESAWKICGEWTVCWQCS